MAIIANVMRKSIGGDTYFFGVMPSSVLRSLTFVPVVEASSGATKYLDEEVSEDNYQRPGSQQRMRKLREHLVAHPESIVPPILLSSRDRWHFEEEPTGGGVGSLVTSGPAAIIDGQHRAGGFVALYEEAEVERPVAFYAVANLTPDRERAQFHTINTTQKNVVASLGVFIMRGENEWAEVAWELNLRETSPFSGRITRIRRKRGDLFSLAALAKNVERMFANGCFNLTTPEERIGLFESYWNEIFDAFPEESAEELKRIDAGDDMEYKLLETTGLILWSHLADQILPLCYNPDSKELNHAKLGYLIRSAGKIDWRKSGSHQGKTGEAGANWIRREMEMLLSKAAT
jgi:DNA sulfur modification protein DndB